MFVMVTAVEGGYFWSSMRKRWVVKTHNRGMREDVMHNRMDLCQGTKLKV